MEKTVRTEGKTTTEAIEKGLKELGVSKDKVEIKVLEEEKRSFYSILRLHQKPYLSIILQYLDRVQDVLVFS